MFESKKPVAQSEVHEPKQRRMMVIALTLLIVALGFVLFRDRDFWFPDTQDAMDAESPASESATATPPAQTSVAKSANSVVASKHGRTVAVEPPKGAVPAAPSDPPGAQIQRTVLPPLEVEVVAGDAHRTVRPGSNSVHVDLQPDSAQASSSQASSVQPSSIQREIADAPEPNAAPATAANLTKASERVDVSADASQLVSHSVRPGYPMLARQMKVQGSVILQALISRDGAIQDLHVMSGPPILAGAAREAVKQWRFKPHYLGTEAVETQAKITVNFTISTN